jgi:phospholipase/carboxylesterase
MTGRHERGLRVVLLHGFGAPGDDLVPLADESAAPPGTRWVFPAAPLQPPQLAGGRAWWMLDLERLERSIASGEPRDLSDEAPVGLAEARAHVTALVQSLMDEGLAPEPLVLGGFSQGAMLACDVALHLPRPPAALVLLSGAPITLATWMPLLPRLAGVPIFQSHGRADALLSFAAAEKLAERLRAAGADLEWVPFSGGHEIPRAVLSALASSAGRDQRVSITRHAGAEAPARCRRGLDLPRRPPPVDSASRGSAARAARSSPSHVRAAPARDCAC